MRAIRRTLRRYLELSPSVLCNSSALICWGTRPSKQLRSEVRYRATLERYLEPSPRVPGNELVGDVPDAKAEALLGHVCVGFPVAISRVRVQARRGRVRHAGGRHKT